MKAAVCFCVLLLGASPAMAEHWWRAVVADDVAITVHELTPAELALKMGRPSDARRVRVDLLEQKRAQLEPGYAVLYRQAGTGALLCNVYVVADAPAATLEHEYRHCHGWQHD